jgi:hypothetical protein
MLCGYHGYLRLQYIPSAGRSILSMNSGGTANNPVQVCAYLKYASGWTETSRSTGKIIQRPLDRTAGETGIQSTLPTRKGRGYEYYLFENASSRVVTRRYRARASRSGTSTKGNRDDQRKAYNTNTRKYECTWCRRLPLARPNN